jgi:hypothetical protein
MADAGSRLAFAAADATRLIELKAREFVELARAEPYDWPEPMSKELYAAYKALDEAVGGGT